MIRNLLLAAGFVIWGSAAQAVPVSVGETLRGAYSLPGVELDPQAFLLRLASTDLFGNGDAVAISLLDSGLMRLTSTSFDSSGAGLDPTVGITIDPGDFLPGVLPSGSPPRVPASGFLEVTALAGSFDVNAVDFFALEEISPGFTLPRQTRVSDFQRVEIEATPVPAPSSAGLLLMGLAAFAAMRRRSWPFLRPGRPEAGLLALR